jgi:hypothetical protein
VAPAPAIAAPLDVRFATLREAVDALIEIDPSLRCNREAVTFLERESQRLQYALSTSVNDFDQWGEWSSDGAKTATAWIDTVCHVPKSEAKAQLRRGKALPGLPVAAAAWRAGDIGTAQVDALIRVKRPVTEQALARDESLLVDYAKEMKFAHFSKALDYWEQLADQDGTEEAARARRERRDVYLVPESNGYFGKMNFGAIEGAIVAKELERLEAELFKLDWEEAKERLGRDPRPDDLARTSAQRRADSMIEMAVRSASARASEGRHRRHRLSDSVRAHLSVGAGSGRDPGVASVLDEYRQLRADHLFPRQTGRVLGHLTLFHRGHPKSARSTRSRVSSRVLRPFGRQVRDGPHRPSRSRRPHHPGERPGPVRFPQSTPLRATPARRVVKCYGRPAPGTEVCAFSNAPLRCALAWAAWLVGAVTR